MKVSLSVFIFSVLYLSSSAQKISYTIPGGYEKYISKKDYKTLVDLSVSTIEKRYTIAKMSDGSVFIAEGEKGDLINLHDLIVICASIDDKTKWPKVIQGHFEGLFAAMDERKAIDIEKFESVRKYLSIRIYPAEIVHQRGIETVVTRKDLEGTYSTLMLDLPGAFASVNKAMFAAWQKDTAEVFRLAQENINKHKVEKLTTHYAIEGGRIEVSFLDNPDYAASYALDLLNNAPELVGDWGSVVSIPNKGMVTLCRVSKESPVDFVKFIQLTKPAIEKSYSESAQRISADYFWYYQGTFKKIMVLTDAMGNVNVIAPIGLAELMTEKQ